MFQISFTVADTHFHAVQQQVKPGDNRRNVRVLATDLFSGRVHTALITEHETCAIVAVAMAGEDYKLPAELVNTAEEGLHGFPDECRPIP